MAGYIEKVNAIEVKAQQPSRLVSDAGRILAKPKGDRAAAEQNSLKRAAAKLDLLRVQVAAVETPEEARRLRSLLLQADARRGGDRARGRAVRRVPAGVPGRAHSARPGGREPEGGPRCQVDRRGEGSRARHLRCRLAATLRRLRGIDPPPASEPQYATQVRTLEQVRAATIALAKAVRAKRAKQLPGLLNRFQRAAVGNQSLSAQRAQIVAVQAYNGRVEGLDELRRKLAVERARLERTLG